jgi:hypothetical protein
LLDKTPTGRSAKSGRKRRSQLQKKALQSTSRIMFLDKLSDNGPDHSENI